MMITVKQYAEERGITIQAVHQSMKGKRKKDLLEGHVYTVEGVKWLDEEAVKILDEYRHKSPIVIEREESDETIENLKLQIENLLIKTAAQADRISELAEWKADHAVAIAEANQTKQLLEDKSKEVGILEGYIRDAKKEILVLTEEKNKEIERVREESKNQIKEAREEAVKDIEDQLYLEKQRADQLQAKLEEVEKLPFWKRMFWHR